MQQSSQLCHTRVTWPLNTSIPGLAGSSLPPQHFHPMTSVSVLILTLNEEVNIGACLDACGWCDDVVVFDSLSSDRTHEIALAKGARFVQRRFDNYAAQRNAALNEVT